MSITCGHTFAACATSLGMMQGSLGCCPKPFRTVVPNDQGGAGGIICANTDDTQRVIGERQLKLRRELAVRASDARTSEEACTLSASCLEVNPHDLPFAMVYLVDPDGRTVRLA